ncbi:MAG: hypothetical protein CMB16_04560 [Euryarchaeota archaeon]|nr:hypothetical protein [Euryarchaeota archaeon]|tara:strand:+ start:1210 stop:1908 length:699 start_codon:yes stop_codon:yes gene_type:complete
MNIKGEVVVLVGLAGAGFTLCLAFLWVPSVSTVAFSSPESQRIFYWHVPSAWAAMMANAMLFVGSTVWFFKRRDWAWRLHVASSEAALATGLMVIWSGCIWGSAEWGVPWDWTDVRLNTFAMLTLLSLFIVLGRRTQPDGVETRDTFCTFGMYGFILVPFTYISTRLWQIRHPGPVMATSKGSIDWDMRIVLYCGALSFLAIITGYIISGMRLAQLEMRLEKIQAKYDEVVE